jgi:hypothetical protein
MLMLWWKQEECKDDTNTITTDMPPNSSRDPKVGLKVKERKKKELGHVP